MKTKWNEKCWNCGSRHMVDQGDFAGCEDCGATATPPVEAGVFPLAHLAVSQGGDYADIAHHGNSPSPALVRKIELERSQKSAQGVKSKGKSHS